MLPFLLLINPVGFSVSLSIVILLWSVEIAPCRVLQVVVLVVIVEIETVPSVIIIAVVSVGVVEVKIFPYGVVLLILPVGGVLVEVETVPCGVILLVVPVGVVEVVPCVLNVILKIFSGNVCDKNTNLINYLAKNYDFCTQRGMELLNRNTQLILAALLNPICTLEKRKHSYTISYISPSIFGQNIVKFENSKQLKTF